jgi:hypothetical protein
MRRKDFIYAGFTGGLGVLCSVLYVKFISNKPVISNDDKSQIINANDSKFKGVYKNTEPDVVGVHGAISNQTGNYPPPLDKSRWFWAGEVTRSYVWGNKAQSGSPYLTDHGLGHVINGQGRYNGQSYASVPILIHTPDLLQWDDYSRPVLEYSDWQLKGWRNASVFGRDKWGRVSPYALVYDDINRQFVLYFQSRQELRNGPPGIRSVGLATSPDMMNWQHQEQVWYTIDDWLNDFPGYVRASEKSLVYRESYPWVVAAWKHKNYFYIIVNGLRSAENGLTSVRKVLRSEHATHSFEPYPMDETGMMPYAAPVEYDGIWYLPWRDSTHVGVYTAGRLEGPYENFTPLFEIHPPYSEISRSQGFNLFRWNGKWCITYHVNPAGKNGVFMWGMET